VGARVITATNELAAMKTWAVLRTEPDLFVLDYWIGDHSIHNFVTMLCSKYPRAKERMAIVTGWPDMPEVRAISSEIKVMEKPLTDWNLVALAELASRRDSLGDTSH